jgi:hypothetical protein
MLAVARWRISSFLARPPGWREPVQGLAANYGTRPTMAQASSRLAMLKCCDSATRVLPNSFLKDGLP